MAAYYNEIDPFAAAWLRELIKANLIADGEVDERSIELVQPGDLRGFTQCHFFAGIGGWSYALRLAGWGDDRAVWTGSCPCQPFSAAGRRDGGSDPRHLWPTWFQLVAELRPGVIFGEQVESAIGHGWIDRVFDDLEGADYALAPIGLPSASVGAYDIRQRLWFVADAGSERRQQVTNDDNKSPTAHLAMKSRMGGGRTVVTSLQVMAKMTYWATPNTADALGGASVTEALKHVTGQRRPSGALVGSKLRNDVLLAHFGPTPNGLSALTVGRGQLNPAHARWLMGYPPEWDACAVTAMQSIRTSRQRSSKRTTKP